MFLCLGARRLITHTGGPFGFIGFGSSPRMDASRWLSVI